MSTCTCTFLCIKRPNTFLCIKRPSKCVSIIRTFYALWLEVWYWYGRGTHMCRMSWEVWFVMIDREVLYSPKFSQAINLCFSRKLTDGPQNFTRESNGHVHNMWALSCCEKFIRENYTNSNNHYINFSEIAISFKMLLEKCIRLS